MRLCAILLAVTACTETHAPARLTVSTAAIAQALANLSALPTLTPDNAVISGACTDGTAIQANAIAVTPTQLTFADVPACGQAHLTLTLTISGIVAFVGDADTVLAPGEVAVDFAGPLFGVLALTADRPWLCHVNGQDLALDTTGLDLSLAVGAYTLTCGDTLGESFSELVKVPAAAVTTVAVAPSTVVPPPLPDASLASLSITPGIFAAAFDPQVLDYNFTTRLSAQALTIVATPTDSHAQVTVNGKASFTIAFTADTFDLSVVVVNGAVQNTYTVHVTRSTLNDDATLEIVGFTNFEFFGFSPTILTYAVDVSGMVTDTLVAATPEQGTTKVTINGQSAAAGDEIDLPLSFGHNVVTIVTLAADGFTSLTYTFDLSRELPSALSDLHPETGTLHPFFSPGTTRYTLDLQADRTSIVFDAIPEDFANAVVTIDGLAPGPISLPIGTSTHTIVCTDGAFASTYLVDVTRGLISNILTPSLGSFNAAKSRYDLAASSPYNVVVLTPNSDVTITVNDVATTSGVSTPVAAPKGVSIARIDAVSDGEHESYWIRNVNGTPIGRVAIEANASSIATATIAIATDNPSDAPQALSWPNSDANAFDVDPTGAFLFQATPDGSVQSVSLSGFAALSNADNGNGGSFLGVVASPRGKSVFTYDNNDILSAFAYDDSGTLSFSGSSNYSGTVTALTAIAVEPSGRFLFVAANASTSFIDTYFVNGDGSITQGPQSTVSGATAMCADPSATHLFALDGVQLTRYTIGPDGSLGSPATFTSAATSIVCEAGDVFLGDGASIITVDPAQMTKIAGPFPETTTALSASGPGDPRFFAINGSNMLSFAPSLTSPLSAIALNGATMLHVIDQYVLDSHLGALVPDHGALSPNFSPTQLDYSLVLAAERQTVDFGGSSAADANASFLVDSTGQVATLPLGASTHHIVVTNGTAQTTYTVQVQRGLISDISTAGLATFASTTTRYDLTASSAYALSVSTSDPAVSASVDDSAIVSGQVSSITPAVGISTVRIDASINGEQESYWIHNTNGTLQNRLAIEASSGSVATAAINSGTDAPSAAGAPTSFAAATTAIDVDPTGSWIFSANANGLQSLAVSTLAPGTALSVLAVKVVASPRGKYLAASDANANLAIYTYDNAGDLAGPGSGIGYSGTTTALVADPLGRFIFVAQPSEIHVHRWYGDGTTGADHPLGAGKGAVAMCVDPPGAHLFFVDGGTGGQLYRVNISPADGSLTGLIFTSAPYAQSIACLGPDVYWSDGTTLHGNDATGAMPALANSQSTGGFPVAVPTDGDARVFFYYGGNLMSAPATLTGTTSQAAAIGSGSLLEIIDQY